MQICFICSQIDNIPLYLDTPQKNTPTHLKCEDSIFTNQQFYFLDTSFNPTGKYLEQQLIDYWNGLWLLLSQIKLIISH